MQGSINGNLRGGPAPGYVDINSNNNLNLNTNVTENLIVSRENVVNININENNNRATRGGAFRRSDTVCRLLCDGPL